MTSDLGLLLIHLASLDALICDLLGIVAEKPSGEDSHVHSISRAVVLAEAKVDEVHQGVEEGDDEVSQHQRAADSAYVLDKLECVIPPRERIQFL